MTDGRRTVVPQAIAHHIESLQHQQFRGVRYHPEDPNADSIARYATELGMMPLPDPDITFRAIRGASVPAMMPPAPAPATTAATAPAAPAASPGVEIGHLVVSLDGATADVVRQLLAESHRQCRADTATDQSALIAFLAGLQESAASETAENADSVEARIARAKLAAAQQALTVAGVRLPFRG